MTSPLIIAIDGPSGSGKSTLGRMLARELGLLYIDTGIDVPGGGAGSDRIDDERTR
jgi:adenylate kinase family enzyme